MGKTPKLKASAQSKSIHSRAAKRAHSPSIDLDKSLTSAKRPGDPGTPRSLLGAHRGAGVTKRKAVGKPMSRAQKQRQAKGLERAEVVLDKTESKVAKSREKGRTVKERGTTWDDLNGRIRGPKKEVKAIKAEDDPWEDLEMQEEAKSTGSVLDDALSTVAPVEMVLVAPSKPQPADEVEDEIT